MSRNGGQSLLKFMYNADGIRTNKIVDGVNHVYTLNGTQIVSEAWGTNLLIYLYDESGAPIGMQYRTNSYAANVFDTFYFEKNLQGDIIAVYNADGDRIGSYIYDAWGNFTVTVESTNTILESKIVRIFNPFRYRGYYYDTETQLYYLQSRYYNPAWGRFLNADGMISTGTGLLGYNMYAYCNNNPVMYVDSNGNNPVVLFKAIVAVAVVVVVVAVACSIAAEIAMPSKEEHYKRNENNTITMPPTEDGVPEGWLVSNNKEDTTREKGPAANAHQFTASDHKSNVKYVSKDKRMEAIYDANGNLVEDPRDIGTYNYGTSLIGHYVKDVKPWIRWGNSPDDTTTPWERMWGLLGIYG